MPVRNHVEKHSVAETQHLRDAGLENYVIEEMHRGQLIAAAYNPRKISDSEKAKLKAALKRHGFVAPIIWNRRTGNVVGGHQRINAMDSLMGTSDYRLSVSVVDVDVPKEKELNVLLNNTHAMGTFDMDQLKDIFGDSNVSVAGAGFSQSDMIQLFGETVFDNRSADLEEFSATLAKIAEQYDAIKTKNLKKGESEFFLVFVFPSGDHVEKFIADNDLEDNRYQNGLDLAQKLNGH